MQKEDDIFIRKLIKKYNLYDISNCKLFLSKNLLNLSIDCLSRIAEMINTSKESTAAYYTDTNTVAKICENLPTFNKKTLKILEPSVGVGNILRKVINHYLNSTDFIECDVFDINKDSLEFCKLFIQKEFNDIRNIKINYFNIDFLTYPILEKKYDLVVGNPPFIKIKNPYKNKMRHIFDNPLADNISAFFLDKSIQISQKVSLIMPKYFLHNSDFLYSRNKIKAININCIMDFGEIGFKGVLIETICLFLDTNPKDNSKTTIVSVPKKYQIIQNQNEITQSCFPNWIIYINENFRKLASNMIFNIFTVFRDRQITSKMLNKKSEIWVIKSKNIPRDGNKIVHINDDVFIEMPKLLNLGVFKYLNRDDVFLSPNMTYYPRVVKKPKNCIVNGSVAIFELKPNYFVSEEDLSFFSSPEFEEFYRIARNNSTRSLNIDKIAIFYFGKKKNV